MDIGFIYFIDILAIFRLYSHIRASRNHFACEKIWRMNSPT